MAARRLDCTVEVGGDLTATAEAFHLKEWVVAKRATWKYSDGRPEHHQTEPAVSPERCSVHLEIAFLEGDHPCLAPVLVADIERNEDRYHQIAVMKSNQENTAAWNTPMFAPNSTITTASTQARARRGRSGL